MFLAYCSLYVCYHILTPRVISQTMNDNINFLLIIPMAGCTILTSNFWWLVHLSEKFPFYWIVYVFLGLAVSQATILTFGILAGIIKSRRLLQIYLFFLAFIIGGFLLAGTVCLQIVIFVKALTNGWEPTSNTIADIACTKNLIGCTNCVLTNEDDRRCPEWSESEVKLLLSVEIRLVAVTMFVFSFYHIGACIVTYVFQSNLKNYKSDFI